MAEIRGLPSHEYDEGQWRILDQLLRLLPSCAAQLELVIREQGRGDYVAVADTARRALMSDEGPTDLALALDYRISHILVDEFQDTSAAQVELLRLLTSGWEAGDGRTLFCVGDPMQSIYGFREAEVGLFLDVRRMGGINEVPVDSLTLEVNFRSRQGVVDWVNRTFPSVMPDHEDARLGAVPFVGAHAYHAPGSDEPVCFHAFEEDDGRQEADRVRSVVQDIRRRDPKASVAVLVRGRNHLEHIAPLLRKAGLRFQAVEIEKLVGRPVVQVILRPGLAGEKSFVENSVNVKIPGTEAEVMGDYLPVTEYMSRAEFEAMGCNPEGFAQPAGRPDLPAPVWGTEQTIKPAYPVIGLPDDVEVPANVFGILKLIKQLSGAR